MKHLIIGLLCFFCLLKPAIAKEYKDSDYSYEARQARYKKQVQTEVQRKHELELEAKRIEVLAKLYAVSAGQTIEVSPVANSYSAGSNVHSTNSALGGVSTASSTAKTNGNITNNPNTGAGNDSVVINN